MNRSRLEWADFAWAPITGCMRECTACVPRKRAFCASIDVRHHITDPRCKGDKDARLFELEEPFSSGRNIIALPFGFFPTRHRYRDDNPGLIKVSRRFLVGHMGDMFGEWVPDKWIEEVFESCARYPYHRYMFITKTPWRYEALWRAGKLPVRSNYWYGTVLENSQDTAFNAHGVNSFALIEPVSGSFANPAGHTQLRNVSWVVLSAESGRAAINERMQAVWAKEIVEIAAANSTPVFVRNNLRDQWLPDAPQEYPAELLRENANTSDEYRAYHYGRCPICGQESPTREMLALMVRVGRTAPRRLWYVHRPCLEHHAQIWGGADTLDAIIEEMTARQKA